MNFKWLVDMDGNHPKPIILSNGTFEWPKQYAELVHFEGVFGYDFTQRSSITLMSEYLTMDINLQKKDISHNIYEYMDKTFRQIPHPRSKDKKWFPKPGETRLDYTGNYAVDTHSHDYIKISKHFIPYSKVGEEIDIFHSIVKSVAPEYYKSRMKEDRDILSYFDKMKSIHKKSQ